MQKLITLLLAAISIVTTFAVDYNGDGEADMLLFNNNTRQTAVWYLNYSTFIGGAYGPTIPTGWNLVTEADFNNDSHPDYLLFNPSTRRAVVWFLNGMSFVGGAYYGPVLPAGWEVINAGDFNGDDQMDLLLENTATQQTAIWHMSGATFIGGAYAPTVPPGWLVKSVADFNFDDYPDIVLFAPSTRKTAIWYMHDATLSSAAYGPTIASGWKLCEIADLDGDSFPDYILDPNGQVAGWNLHPFIPPSFKSAVMLPQIAAPYAMASNSKAAGCSVTVGPTYFAIPSSGGNYLIAVGASRDDCTWFPAYVSIGTYKSIAITYPGSGRGNSSVTFYVKSNSGAAKKYEIKVAGKTVTIIQAAKDTPAFVAGHWTGSVQREWRSGSGCSAVTTGFFDLNITQSNSTLGGNGTENGAPCFNEFCGIDDTPTVSGTLQGTVTGFNVTLTLDGQADNGNCAGQGFTIVWHGTISSNFQTMTLTDGAGYVIHLTKN
jgi:hypothetical protein